MEIVFLLDLEFFFWILMDGVVWNRLLNFIDLCRVYALDPQWNQQIVVVKFANIATSELKCVYQVLLRDFEG